MDPRARFRELVAREDAEIPLAETALVIAATERDVDVTAALEQLDALAGAIRPRLGAASSLPERVAVLCRGLFEGAGFRGNAANYGDPENSFLDAVLRRRTGIPITLSVVLIEVARKLGLDARGVGFPGHFLAKICEPRQEIVVDAFFGRTMSQDDCARRLVEVVGAQAEFHPAMLEASSHRQIIQRILTNLKLLYVAEKDYARALGYSDRIVELAGDDLSELRDRGLLHRALECHASALDDLERYLDFAPADPAAPALHAMVDELRGQAAQLH